MQVSRLYRGFVAKADRQNQNRYLPLWMHTKDTVAVMRSLTDAWLSESVISVTGLKHEEFQKVTRFLAALHDIGKISNAFAYQITHAFPKGRAFLEPLQLREPPESKHQRHTIVGAAILHLLGVPEWMVSVVGAHHGKIMREDLEFDAIRVSERRSFYGALEDETTWQSLWQEHLNVAMLEAGYDGAIDLPREMSLPAQMLLIALLITADWLASNETIFPLIDVEQNPEEIDYVRRISLGREKLPVLSRWRPGNIWQYTDLCTERFGYDHANLVQQAIAEEAGRASQPGMFILEAPMGVGKTEAALMAGEILAARLGEDEGVNGLAFFLPSQATSNAMYERMMSWLQCFAERERTWLDDDGTSGQLAISLAHGKAMLNEQFAALVSASTDADGTDGVSTNRFFMGRKTKLMANFVVGTVDQMLMGALNQKHLMLRHLGMAGKVIVVDEVHAYDAHMMRYLKTMLDWLGAYHTPVILLSATLPGQRRAEMIGAYLGRDDFDEKNALESLWAYPILTWTDGQTVHTRTIPLAEEKKHIRIRRGQDEDIVDFLRGRLGDGGCAGVVVNTVKRAQRLARRLAEVFQQPAYEILLDHAQFLMSDRVERENQLLLRVGKHSMPAQRNGLIVVGTQVLEQSLDIDFDVLVCDLCPMDLLLQRLGRLHRHWREGRPASLQAAECLVLNADGEVLEAGSKAIYGEYLLRQTAALLPKNICLPDDISPLVQETYQKKTPENPEMRERYSEYEQNCAKQDGEAAKTCIPRAKRKIGRRRTTRLIDGLMDYRIDQNEAQEQALVRSGVASVEVLVLQYGVDRKLHLATRKNCDFCVSPQVAPSFAEEEIILRQSLRLPYEFHLPGLIQRVLDELEAIRQSTLREWTASPRIGKELFLLLDSEGCTELAGKHVRYDDIYGFQGMKEETDRGEGI